MAQQKAEVVRGYKAYKARLPALLAMGHVAPDAQEMPVPPTILISEHEDVETLLSFYTKGDQCMVTAAMATMP